jgi:hypothetical protein
VSSASGPRDSCVRVDRRDGLVRQRVTGLVSGGTYEEE